MAAKKITKAEDIKAEAAPAEPETSTPAETPVAPEPPALEQPADPVSAPAPGQEPAQPTPSETPEAEEDEGQDQVPGKPPAPKLLTLSAAAGMYRVPSWQSAALHKLMGWEPGKSVTVEEYGRALVRLKNRRLGG
jgi:hypothetical protein